MIHRLAYLSVYLVLSQSALPESPAPGLQSWVWEVPELYPAVPIAAPNSSNTQCRRDSRLLIEGLKNHSQWAAKMWDATPRAAEGIMYGSMMQLGNYDSCLSVTTPVKAQYCISLYSLIIPVTYNNTQTIYPALRDHGKNNRLMPRDLSYMAVCIPASCSADEMSEAMNSHLEGLPATHRVANQTTYHIFIINSSCSTADYLDKVPAEEAAFWIFSALMVALSILCSFFDGGESAAQCFSLRRNVKKLFTFKETPEDDPFYVFHGIKMICIIQVYFVHKIMSIIWNCTSHKLVEDATISPLNAFFIILGDLPCDTFFFISGCLVSYSLYKMRDKRMPNPAFLIMSRFLRLVPMYYFVLWMHTVALGRLSSGPLWNLMYGSEKQFCKDNWWINLLLLSNYIKPDEICLATSWYVNCDLHFFIVAILIIMVLRTNEKIGFALMALIFILASASPGITTFFKEMDPVYMHRFDFVMRPRGNTAYAYRYISSHNRVAIYIMGMIYGILVFKQKGHKKTYSSTTVVFGAILAVLLMFAPSYVGFQFYDVAVAKDSLLLASIYVSLRRPLWGLGCAILLYLFHHYKVSAFKFVFESKFAVFISRLTYGIYLTHFSILISRALSKREPTSPLYVNTVMEGFSDLAATVVLAAIIYVTIDCPIQNLLAKYLFAQKPKRKPDGMNLASKTLDSLTTNGSKPQENDA